MLKTRVIQTVLYNSKMMVVKPKAFERPGRSVTSLMSLIKNLNCRNLDELILIDIDATKEQRLPFFDKIKQFTSELFCPVTLGGGIATVLDMERYFCAGADKVCLNSKLTDDDLIKDAVRHFGSQAIVAAIDVKTWTHYANSWDVKYKPTIKGGIEFLDVDLLEFVRHLEELGIGEILLTAVHKDGLRSGYDKRLLKMVTNITRVPIIANGGNAGFNDMLEALKCGVDAVAASSMFLFTGLTPRNASFYLDNHGYPSRVEV